MAIGWIRDVDVPDGPAPDVDAEFGAPTVGRGHRSPVRLASRTRVEAGGRVAAPLPTGHREAAPGAAGAPAPNFAAPLLLLLAGLATLEGYTWLNVISDDRWRSWAVVFAVLTVGAAVVLIRPLRRDNRLTARLVVSVSVLMLVTTVLAVMVKGQAVARLAGAADLLVALTALGAAALIEHHSRRPA